MSEISIYVRNFKFLLGFPFTARLPGDVFCLLSPVGERVSCNRVDALPAFLDPRAAI
jgi:hypothetical protein